MGSSRDDTLVFSELSANTGAVSASDQRGGDEPSIK
jgi:hypothetical protein